MNYLKKYFKIFILFLLIPFNLHAQWVEKEVDNNLFVKFPSSPTYEYDDELSRYSAQTENCWFAVVITDKLPKEIYAQILLLTENEQKHYINTILDGAVQGELYVSDNVPVNVKSFKIGKYYGREYSYSAINPKTGNKGLRYVKIISKETKIIIFYCVFLQNSQESLNEKNTFLNSLKYNREK